MTTSYTPSLRLILADQGSAVNTWGTLLNTSLITLVDTSISGYLTINIPSDADYTLTTANGASDQARYAFLNFTSSALTTGRNIIIPAVSKEYGIVNNTSYPLTIKTASGSGIAVPSGYRAKVICDSANVYDASSYHASLLVGSLNVSGSTSFSSSVTISSTLDVTTLHSQYWGLRVRASSAGDSGAIQFTDNAASVQLGDISVDTSGNMYLAPSAGSAVYTGTIISSGSISASANGITIQGASGTNRNFYLATTGTGARWGWVANSTAESGGNAGSDLSLSRFSDTGTYIDSPISVTRSSGVVSFTNRVYANGGLSSIGTMSVSGSGTFSGTINAGQDGTNGYTQLTQGTSSISGYLSFYLNSGTRIGYVGYGGLGGFMNLFTDGNTNLSLGTNGSTRMTITSAGAVGIGTTNPASPFEVQAANSYVYSTGTAGYGSFYARGSGTNAAYIFMGNTTNNEQARISAYDTGIMLFSNGNGAVERMRITSGGVVSIGDSVPPASGVGLMVGNGAVQNIGMGNIGQYEAVWGGGSTWYNAGFRNDGNNFYFLTSASQSTQAGAQTAGYNSLRPLTIGLGTGSVSIAAPTSGSNALNLYAASGNLALYITGGGGGGSAVSITDTGSSSGAQITFTGNGGTTPNKYLRVTSGVVNWVNSAYSSVIWQLDDSGNVTNYGSLSVSGTISGNLSGNVSGNVTGSISGGSVSGSSLTATSGGASITGNLTTTGSITTGVNLYMNSNAILGVSTSTGYTVAGGSAYNNGGAIAYFGSAAGGTLQFYSGTGGTNANVGQFAANGVFSAYYGASLNADSYFGSNYGPTSQWSIGYRGVPQTSPGTSYTGVLQDAGKHIAMPSGNTFYIPANGSVAYPVGTTITIFNYSTSGNVTIAINSDTLYWANTAGTTGSRTLAPMGLATAMKFNPTQWVISGVGLS